MRAAALAFALGLLATLATGVVSAQSSREAEQRLQKIRSELKDVAAERRRLEGQRGDASRQLRAADEQVGQVGRAVRDTSAPWRAKPPPSPNCSGVATR